jgi:hypothetical protein
MEQHERDELYGLKGKVQALEIQYDALKMIVATLVTRPEFIPVKLVVYGMVGSIMAGVVGALLSKILI